MILALGCIAAVVCGAALARVDGPLVAVLALAVAALTVIWLRAITAADDEDRWRTRVAAASLVVLGLARGAGVDGPTSPGARVPERGSTAALRELEVVGASEPGVRCELEVRDPEAPRGPTLRISAPPEDCPLAAGDRIAVLAPSLSEGWREALSDRVAPVRDLGRGPVLWRRPSPRPTGLRRISSAYWRGVATLRQRAWVSTRADPDARLVVAVGLGLRSALSPEQRERLRAAGLGHLIAVSGLHVAVAALWLQALSRRGLALCGGSPRWACVLAWLPLWGYVALTGAAASAVRAALMLTGIDLAALVGRPRHGPTLLVVAAAVMLVAEPSWLLDPGFALSLAAMAAIVTAPRELGTLAISWRITWATAPLSVVWFDAAPVHGLLANAVALPLFAWLMPLSLVAVLGPGPIAALALAAAKLFATPILDLAGVLARLPAAGPRALGALALAALLGHRRRSKRRETEPSSWLPPRLAAVLALVVAAALLVDAGLDRRRIGPPRFDWIALGTVHSRSLVVADPSQPGAACVHRPTDSAATYLAVLELVEIRRISRLDAALPEREELERPPEEDPRTAALRERLGAAGIDVGDQGRCEPPPAAEVRAALRACRDRQPESRPRSLVLARAGVVRCRVGDRWVEMPEV